MSEKSDFAAPMPVMENNRLIDSTRTIPPAEAHLALSHPEIPAVCVRIIAGYSPNQPSSIWPEVQQFTIDCAVAMKPTTHANARRWMTMIALFSTWVVTVAGGPVTPERIFRQSYLDRYLKRVLAKHSPAYRFDSSRLLVKVAHTLLDVRLSQLPTPRQSEAVFPHTPKDLARIYSWANTLSTPLKRQNARALVSLAAGAGLTAQQIMDAQVGDVEFIDGRAFVTVHEGRQRQVPVRTAWVRTLTSAIGDRTSGTIFKAYRLEEYPPHQLQQFLTKNRGELRPSVARLRAGWLVSLLEANLPLDVLLNVTGFTTPASLRPYIRHAKANDTTEWFAQIVGEVNE